MPVQRVLFFKDKRVNSRAGEEGGGFALGPGVVAGAEEGRSRVGALAGGHVEERVLLVAGGDDEALRGAETRGLDAGDFVVAGQGLGGEV